jgi:tRNA-2-methylthio-N6-dimethylallyladenosine synthase
MARRYLVRTFGCQMNEHDSELISGLLEADGMEATGDPEQADVVVLNTCCIRENADNKLYGHLGQLKALKARKPGMQIAVGGCLAQKDRDLVQRRAAHVDVVFGTHNLEDAVELLHRAEREGPVTRILDSPPAEAPSWAPRSARTPGSAWVTIQVGCDNSCSFCIVPSVRGPEVSRPFGEVVAEVASLAAAGVSEVTLLGQNVNSYGRDIALRLRAGEVPPVRGSKGRAAPEVWMAGEAWVAEGRRRPRPLFADLLGAVGRVPGIRRVRYTSPHPKDLRPETIQAMAETPAVCEHLHLPLQAGSDRVLSEMRRGYTVERYARSLAEARARVEDLAVTTDLIVGFPGETEEDFERTLEVVAASEYDSAYTFVFSPRPGTRAAGMRDRFVPPAVSAERFERLKVAVERSALSKHRARVGRREEVMVEGPSKRDPGLLTGRTRQNKLVHFAPPQGEGAGGAGALAPGSYATVRVVSAAPHHLLGELESAEAARRRLIPVAAG